jgi:hypothetical protein
VAAAGEDLREAADRDEARNRVARARNSAVQPATAAEAVAQDIEKPFSSPSLAITANV